MQASRLKEQTGSGLVKWRLHTYFEIERNLPTRIIACLLMSLWTGRKATLLS